jgi:hypothetical protein
VIGFDKVDDRIPDCIMSATLPPHGGTIVPGFRLSVRTLFSPPTKPDRRRKK